MILLRGLNGPDTTPAWRSVLLRDPCVYCGAPAMSLDHIQPLAAGGPHAWTNRAPACHRCNGEKGCTLLLLFLAGERTSSHTIGKARARRRERPELPPPAPLTFTIGELLAVA